MADQIYSLAYFTGINNVDNSTRLAPTSVDIGGIKAAYPLSEAVNVEIDNTYGLKSRPGCDLKVSGTAIHSLWGQGDYGFYVDGGVLYLLNPDYTTLSLATGLSNARMSYVKVNDRVYMTNGTYIGYYSNSVMNALATPAERYKLALPPGQRIAYFKGVLMVAYGKMLYMSDALCDHYDIRTGFLSFENNITMVRPVDDGIYVSDGKTWFLVERRAFADDPSVFRKEFVSSLGAVPFSDVNIDGAYVGDGKLTGNLAMWTTSEGILVGDNKGTVKNITPNYLMKQLGNGAAAVRNSSGNIHYIATLR